MVTSLQHGEKKHFERDLRLQLHLDQAYKESRTNMCLKLFSFVGMTMIAVSRYVEPNSTAYESTFIIGLTLSTLVASAYFTYNSERLLNGLGKMSHRFFSCSQSNPNTSGTFNPTPV